MKKSINRVFQKIISFVLIVAMALTFCACKNGSDSAKTESNQITSAATATEIGEGKTKFYFNAYDENGNITQFIVHTDEKTVGDALLKLDLISGESGDYGLYVKKVNGITADYDTSGTYWAFYRNGKYADKGADLTDITEDATYEFKIEK